MTNKTKNKVEEPAADNVNAQIIKQVTKEYGAGIIVGADEVIDEDQQIIPFSPAIDIGLSGGVPEGSWIILSGKPKCGKTVNSLHFAAKCQRPENGGRKVYYLDIEGRLKRMHLEGIFGLRREQPYFNVIRSRKGRILSAEDYLEIGENIIKSEPGCLLIIDSISMLCGEGELNSEVKAGGRKSGPMLMAQFCRQIANVVPVNNNLVIGIMHIMANTSGFGASLVEKGGWAIKFQVDVKLKAKTFSFLDDNVGQKVTWKVDCSALGPPGAEIESYIRYGVGVDELYELAMIGTDCNIIKKVGGWYHCAFVEDSPKFHGMSNLYAGLKDNPEWQPKLYSEIMKVLA